MLFNKDWDNPKDIMSAERLLAWLEKQPSHKEYDYERGNSCLLAQYFRANGEKFAVVGDSCVYFGSGCRFSANLPYTFRAAAGQYAKDRTFGGGLQRLKAEMGKEKENA